MTWFVLAMIVALAVLGPLFGADSRESRDTRQNRR